MKSLVLVAMLFVGSWAQAESIDFPGEYELIQAAAFCQKTNCRTDEETGAESCRLRLRFDEQSFEEIQSIKEEKGLNKTWFPKSPREICESGDFPFEEENAKSIKVILYKVDLGVLNDKF